MRIFFIFDAENDLDLPIAIAQSRETLRSGSVYKAAHLAAELVAPQPAQVSKIDSYNAAGTGTGTRSSIGLYLGNSTMFAPGVVPAGTVRVSTKYYANGQQLDN